MTDNVSNGNTVKSSVSIEEQVEYSPEDPGVTEGLSNDGFSKGPIPVQDWNKHFHWPPPGGLRHLIFHADTNGFAPAFIRVGRRVLVDPKVFWSIARQQGNQL